jgi:hypothetical protein
MLYLVRFTLNNARKIGVCSGYRADWVSDRKPEYNCAKILFNDRRILPKNTPQIVTLVPLIPELWICIQVGDKLECKESFKTVGEAIILEVL